MTQPDLPDHVPEGPSDNTTLVAVLEGYASAGFDGAFAAGDGPTVTCLTCDVTSPATRLTIDSIRRLEGASDPDDMIAVAAVRCPNCSTAGVLILGYGPAGSDIDADVLVALRDERSRPGTPADAAPGESTAG